MATADDTLRQTTYGSTVPQRKLHELNVHVDVNLNVHVLFQELSFTRNIHDRASKFSKRL